jgi:4-hydroxy-3-methylbut-2-enyl diphosphate reductase
MTSSLPRVQPGSFLTLHYRLSGPQGDVVSTFGGPPATLSLGSGQLSPAVERRLLGLQEGARASFDMPAGEAFGERNPDMIQWLARQELDELVLLAEPRGFCAGVDRAIEIVERALAKHGAPIYVRHEIVHNTYVVNDLKAKGAIFIEDLADVPPGATLVFSAHGVSQAVRARPRRAGFRVFDATCPLVTKVHVEVAKLAKEGFEFIMIGHKGHPEVEGTMGQLSEGIYLVEEPTCAPCAAAQRQAGVVTQTTLSVDDAAEILAEVKRALSAGARAQAAGHLLRHAEPAGRGQADGAGEVDVVIVVGSPTSSNSNRLRELAQRLGTPAYMVEGAADLQSGWFAQAAVSA